MTSEKFDFYKSYFQKSAVATSKIKLRVSGPAGKFGNAAEKKKFLQMEWMKISAEEKKKVKEEYKKKKKKYKKQLKNVPKIKTDSSISQTRFFMIFRPVLETKMELKSLSKSIPKRGLRPGSLKVGFGGPS